MAVSEPALSFEFDSSQSLFEQLTKAQQANTSSFAANAGNAYSSPASPVMRGVDAMPPPSMIPQTLPPVSEEMGSQIGAYTQASMPPTMAQQVAKREGEFPQMQYDRNGVPIGRIHQRHTSMPAYMEYSPAPSFVSSHYEDYSNRGISYEPVTPPQQAQGLNAEPAYIANEETGLYTALPDVSSSQGYPSMMAIPPPAVNGMQFGGGQRGYPGSAVYSVIEGSPTYKQRRRRSSIPPSITAAVAAAAASNGMPHAPHRGSDLRRSMSIPVGAVAEGEEAEQQASPAVPNNYQGIVAQHKELLDLARHESPLPSMEGSPAHQHVPTLPTAEDYQNYTQDDPSASSLTTSPTGRPGTGPVRRARSATMMELGPYPQKSHSCPIPTCGRLFKRLEHLKRYVEDYSRNTLV